jgi:hypothetical protein
MRAAAMASNAFVRVVHTGSHEQIAVMPLSGTGDVLRKR